MNELSRQVSHDLIAEAVAWRRHLHQHPELAYREQETAGFIAAQLSSFGLKVHQGLAGTGVVGTLTRGSSRRSLAIRADMDALPLEEQSGVPHASRTAGIMHACGHDGHVAIALGAARMCVRLPDLGGSVHFIFQPAEEAEGGAARMVHEGLFQLFPCDTIYALHNWPALPVGTCLARDGVMMAAMAVFEVTVSGRGCHSAMPHQGADPILAGCQFVSALHTIVSRNLDPLQAAVVSVTQMHAGETWNSVPETCVIRGSTRWLADEVGDTIESRIARLSASIAAAFGCNVHVDYERRYPATVNDPAAASMVRRVAQAAPVNLKAVDSHPSMASEDFAFMLDAVPGCYLWLGAGSSGQEHGLHSPRYDFNDELIAPGVALWTELVRKSLAGP